MFKRLIKSIFQQQPKQPHDIFENIYGHEDLKELTKSVLHASAPVHLLITGPPQTGKTEICKCIRDAYDCIWIDTYTTIAGLIEKFKENPEVKILIVNEIEKCRQEVRIGLLEILENQRILKTTKTDQYDVHHDVWMIATSNDLDKLKKTEKPFLTRVIVKELSDYTVDEYLDIATFRVQRESGITPPLARYIAEAVLEHVGPEIRKAVALARMSKTEADVDKNVRLI